MLVSLSSLWITQLLDFTVSPSNSDFLASEDLINQNNYFKFIVKCLLSLATLSEE